MDRTRLARPLLVATVAAVTILMQLVQTRILSYLFYAHIVYFTVTIALIGFGVSGAISAIAMTRVRHTDTHAALAACLFALVLVPCSLLASHTTKLADPERVWVMLTACYLLQALPFVFAGYCLSTVFFLGGSYMHRLYFLDLAASGVAVVLFAAGFETIGADTAIWLAVLALIVASSLSLLASGRKWLSALGPIGGVLTLALAGPRFLNDVPLDKIITDAMAHGADLERTIWHPIARLDLISHDRYDIVMRRTDASAGHQKVITQDGGANTFMPDTEYRKLILEQGRPTVQPFPENVMYELVPAPRDALVIGVGGGIDIVSASAYSAKKIVGVEINASTIDIVRGPYAAYAGWPSWPNVELIHDEGRRFVRASGRKFDTIMLKGVDTYSALSSGAYIFSENYLYNVEALQDYLAALRPGGMITMYRHLFSPPRETLRLAVNLWHARQGQGVADSVLIIGTKVPMINWASTIIKGEPFTQGEVERALTVLEQDPRMFPVYLPRLTQKEPLKARAQALQAGLSPEQRQSVAVFAEVIACPNEQQLQSLVERYRYNISPSRDDNPFFFDYRKGNFAAALFGGGKLFPAHSLELLLLVLVVFLSLSVLGPLYVYERGGLKVRGVTSLLGFFACLGFGYMLVEIGLMQLLTLYLGQPIHSLSAVLSGLLLFTGLGALFSVRLLPQPLGLPKFMLLATAVLIAWLLLMKGLVLPRTFTLSTAARTCIVVLSLLPVGFVLGLPFATGVRHLSTREPRFIPWAWGVNGLTSVTGSILATIIAMRLSFVAVVVVASATYAIGALCARKALSAA